MLFSGGRGFFLVLSAAGQARGQWVLYDACRDPGRALSWCFEHSTSLNWLCFQGVTFRLAEQDHVMESPLFRVKIARYVLKLYHYRPLCKIINLMCFTLSAVCYDGAAYGQQQQRQQRQQL